MSTERKSFDNSETRRGGNISREDAKFSGSARDGDARANNPRSHRSHGKNSLPPSNPGDVVIAFPAPNEPACDTPPRHRRSISDFEQKIASMHARKMSAREIQEKLRTLYDIDIPCKLISAVGRMFEERAAKWRNRPLCSRYALVFFGVLPVKIHDDWGARSKLVYVALGIGPDGNKDVLGFWDDRTDDTYFPLRIAQELKARGVTDILIAIDEGIKGLSGAVNCVFPATKILPCIPRMIRQSLDFVAAKDKHSVAAALTKVFLSADLDIAVTRLNAFGTGRWGSAYPSVIAQWRLQWSSVVCYFDMPDGIRRLLLANSAIHSLTAKLRRRAISARYQFQTDEAAATSLIALLQNTVGDWRVAPVKWRPARAQLAGLFGERFSGAG